MASSALWTHTNLLDNASSWVTLRSQHQAKMWLARLHSSCPRTAWLGLATISYWTRESPHHTCRLLASLQMALPHPIQPTYSQWDKALGMLQMLKMHFKCHKVLVSLATSNHCPESWAKLPQPMPNKISLPRAFLVICKVVLSSPRMCLLHSPQLVQDRTLQAISSSSQCKDSSLRMASSRHHLPCRTGT